MQLNVTDRCTVEIFRGDSGDSYVFNRVGYITFYHGDCSRAPSPTKITAASLSSPACEGRVCTYLRFRIPAKKKHFFTFRNRLPPP
ncbi:hypothetical protein EVAR_63234_1 [Eumeta japonica]|uniref:Uncharacterized protein n=1 Tax=Eumeta variegata TaxID=151549 RepID=A0A4C1Z681_EUMVA|nr:hypothetical protein EVAR_63234_1 [Eumeta japonica]